MRVRNALVTGMAVSSLAFMACQQSEQPTAASEPLAPQGGARPVADLPLDGGRLATPEEVKHLLSLPVNEPAAVGETPAGAAPGAAPLSKSAAVPFVNCTIGFNSSSALAALSDHGSSTFIVYPWYAESCNSSYYWVRASAINLDHYHLVAEAADQCYGSGNNWGHYSNGTSGSCLNQSDAMYWPRRAMNMNGNSGIVFKAQHRTNGARNLDLKAIYVKSGSIKVLAYRVGVGWWYWPNLYADQRWYWTGNNTNISEVRVFDTNENGVYAIDNLEVGIYQ